MTNLYPGRLFYASGLNRKSTPLPPEATPSEIDQKLGRVPFNGKPWPKSSPVSHVYDVRNSSTRMIILNNRLSKKQKGSRLRGQTDHTGEIERPEPFRHSSDEPHTNWQHHKKCGTSVSEKFVPIFPPGLSPPPVWVNKTQRPAMKFDNGSGVNPNHHIQCQGHMECDIVQWYNTQRRPRSRTSSVRENRALSPILKDPNLSKGERRYLNHIAKIYSVDNMRVQKQVQYNELMWGEIRKGRAKPSDWEKYYRYLNTPRKTQFGPCDPTRQSRSVSAPGRKKKDDGDESRPHTTQTGAKRSSRGQGHPGGKQGAKSGKKSDSLVGKPARVESPLPLKPRRDSASSLSSIESREDKKEQDKRASNSSDENVTKREGQEEKATKAKDNEVKSQRNLVEDNRRMSDGDDDSKGIKDGNDKRKEEDDDDERSKLSARDNERYDDSNGQTVSYHPTYNERVEDEERSRTDHAQKGDPDSSKEEYKRKDEKIVEKPTAEEEVPVVTLPPAKGKDDIDNNGSSDHSDKDGKVEDSDDIENGPQLIHHIHKEGGDRPLSRLGGRGQFTLVKKDNALNSDDDYSDDEDETPKKGDEPRGEDHPTKRNSTDLSKQGSDQELKGSSALQTSNHPSKGDPSLGLSLQEDNMYESGGGDGAIEKVQDTNPQPSSPTEASSQEKPSTITTLEY